MEDILHLKSESQVSYLCLVILFMIEQLQWWKVFHPNCLKHLQSMSTPKNVFFFIWPLFLLCSHYYKNFWACHKFCYLNFQVSSLTS
jgi:hypothetical protein